MLVGSVSGHAVGQGATTSTPPQSKVGKEHRFKLEWIGKSNLPVTGNNPAPTPRSETITMWAAENDSAVSTNPLPNSDFYRKVILQPRPQSDGTLMLDVTVSEFTKDMERDLPRTGSTIAPKLGEAVVVQTRNSKGSNYDDEYIFSITQEL